MLAFILIVTVVRVAYWKELASNDMFISQLKTDPGTKVTNSTLPDGTPRITIDDPQEQTVVTIDGTGANRTITIKEPADHPRHDGAVMGSNSSNEDGNFRTTVMHTDGPVPIEFFIAFGTVASFIIATILGAPFARENDGHLEIAAMRPQPRYVLALQTVGIDIAGILLTNVVTFTGLTIMLMIVVGIPQFKFDTATWSTILLAVVAPAAWYAFIAAATSSLKRGYTAIVGFAWPVSALIVLFGMIAWPDSILGNLMHNVFSNVMWIDPLAYGSLQFHMDEQTHELIQSPTVWRNIVMESILFLVYSALAIVQWQRVEA
jgi:hypothetical protein